MMDFCKRLLPAAALALALVAPPLVAKPIAVTVSLTDDTDFPGYVTKADQKSLFVSLHPDGKNARPYALGKVKNISWREPNDWKVAMDSWNRRDYGKATQLFAKAMEDYQGISNLEDSIGAQAVFYYMECLRRTGKFPAMMETYARVQKVKLSEKWQDQIRLFQGWAHLAGGKWKPLLLMMQDYEIKEADIPGVGDYTIAPSVLPFRKELDLHHLAQIAYLRGIASEKLAEALAADLATLDPDSEATRVDRESLASEIAQRRTSALTDYSRGFTINYGAERGLALRSMLGVLGLLKKDPDFAENLSLQKEAHGIALLFDGLTNGKLPSQHKALLTPPIDPQEDEKPEDAEGGQ